MPNHCQHIIRYYDHLLRQIELKANYEKYWVEYEYLLDQYVDYLHMELDP